MPRILTTAVAAATLAAFKRPCLLAEIVVDSGTVRLWSGIGDLTYAGNVYGGVGTFGSVSAPEETTDLKASNVVFTLSGVPGALLASGVSSLRQGLPARLWAGFLDDAGALIADPVLWFEGTAAVPSTSDDGETCTLSISAESLMATLKRPRVTRLTPEDQKNRAPGDKGFDAVAALQDRVIGWGRD